eukprot:COSAG01_NODE_23550_length_811_cov_0.846910_2_plen_189_part_00
MTDTIALETSQYALEVDKEELEAQPEVILNMLKTLDDPKAIAQPRNMFTAIQKIHYPSHASRRRDTGAGEQAAIEGTSHLDLERTIAAHHRSRHPVPHPPARGRGRVGQAGAGVFQTRVGLCRCARVRVRVCHRVTSSRYSRIQRRFLFYQIIDSDPVLLSSCTVDTGLRAAANQTLESLSALLGSHV